MFGIGKPKTKRLFRCPNGHTLPFSYAAYSGKPHIEFCTECYFLWLEKSALEAGVSQGEWVDEVK